MTNIKKKRLMTRLIHTKNTSGAIRRLQRKKPKKSYLTALMNHIKFLKSS